MISSRIFIGICTVLFVTDYSAAAECGPGGICKYGGVCGENNQCQCVMKCTSDSWGIDINNIYCIPAAGGLHEKLFFNLCFALVEACERQEDIPIVKYDMETYKCEGSNEISERLCTSPHAFMGHCGGTLQRTDPASHYDGGICLESRGTRQMRCRCPEGRAGSSCNIKSLTTKNCSDQIPREDNSTAKIIGVSIGASVGAALLVCALISLWRKVKSKRTVHRSPSREEIIIGNHGHATDSSNRAEKDYRSGSLLPKTCLLFEEVSETKPAPSPVATPAETTPPDNSKARQRLTGSSIIFNVEDTNNNVGGDRPSRHGYIRQYDAQNDKIGNSESELNTDESILKELQRV